MDTTAIPDNSGADDRVPVAVTPDDRPADHSQRAHRHFTCDPASSPLVMAALAWNGAAAR